MFKLLLLTILVALTNCSLSTQQKIIDPFPTENPELLGFESDSLDNIENVINEYIDRGLIPGATVLVARHGKIAYEKAFGYADRKDSVELTNDHLFRIASMTKPVTSIAVLQLYEQGKLDVNDRVSKYIPEFASTAVLDTFDKQDTTWTSIPAIREITLANLLTHTSGISYSFMHPVMAKIYAKLEVPDAANKLDLTIQQSVKRLAKAPLLHQPGEKFSYGLSTDVLGAVVEIVSGMTLGDYFEKNIFSILNIQNTAFWLSDSLGQLLPTLYRPLGDSAIAAMLPDEGVLTTPDYPVAGAKKYFSGGSGLCASTRDYFVVSQSILNNGVWNSNRILNDTTAMLMHTNKIDTVTFPWGPSKFGYGYQVYEADQEGVRQIKKGRYSWGGALGTSFWIDPARDIVVVIMRQVVFSPHKAAMDGRIETIINAALVNAAL